MEKQKIEKCQGFPLLACLHDLNKSGFFGAPAFVQPIKAI